jgi:hypothetical protein
MTTKQFVMKHNIRFSSTEVGENPDMADPTWMARHYRVTFRTDGMKCRPGSRQFTTYFSMGIAIEREPTAEGVLDCLRSDCQTIENTSGFDEWARELGFGEDSIKAHKNLHGLSEAACCTKALLSRRGDLPRVSVDGGVRCLTNQQNTISLLRRRGEQRITVLPPLFGQQCSGSDAVRVRSAPISAIGTWMGARSMTFSVVNRSF